MLTTRNHRSRRFSAARSHSMPLNRRRSEKSLAEKRAHESYDPTFIAEVISSDETLQRLFAAEVKKMGVVTAAGYRAVFENFSQSQVVVDALKKREDERKQKEKAQEKKTRTFNFSTRSLRKSKVAPLENGIGTNQVDPDPAPRKSDNQRKSRIRSRTPKVDTDKFNITQRSRSVSLRRSKIVPYEPRIEMSQNIAPRRSAGSCSSEDEHKQSKKVKNEIQRNEVIKKQHAKSPCTHQQSKDDSMRMKSLDSSNKNSKRKPIEMEEIVIADCAFKRTNSSTSLRLKDIFEEIDSDDDETLSTGSCSSRDGNTSGLTARKMSTDKKTSWLPWPKDANGDLIVSFPDLDEDDDGGCEYYSDDDGSWERHYV